MERSQTKSAAIRQYIADHPDAKPSAVAKALTESGIGVTPQLVYMVMAKPKKDGNTVVFRRWYTIDFIDNIWCIVGCSKPQKVGPAKLSGKNFYQKALELRRDKNARLLRSRIKLRQAGYKGPEVFLTDHGLTLLEVIDRIQIDIPYICLNDLVECLLEKFSIPAEFHQYMAEAVGRALSPEPESEPVATTKPPKSKVPNLTINTLGGTYDCSGRQVKVLSNEGVNALIVTHNGAYYCFYMSKEIWKKLLKCESGVIESVVARLEQLGEDDKLYGHVSLIDDTNFALPTQNIKPPLNLIDLRTIVRKSDE